VNASKREDDTLDLMRERNALDRQKVSALQSISNEATEEDVEEFIRHLPWSDDATENEKTIAAGNIRNFWQWCQSR